MICKSLLFFFFFCYVVKYHDIFLKHIDFFTYDSYIVYRLFFTYTAFSLHYCTYHMYGTYIFNNNISHEFYHIQCTLCLMYYKCYRTVHHWLLHSLLLKVYMYLISINLILFVQLYWLQFLMRYMLYL